MKIININDNPPIFKKNPILINKKKNLPTKYTIHTFTTTNKNSEINKNIRYNIQNQTPNKTLFTINPISENLKITSILNYEKIKQISLIIQTQNQYHAKYQQKTTITA